MLDQNTVRRREDGSIDFDFYRQQGLAERRAVLRRTVRSLGKPSKPFAVATIVAMVLTVMFGTTGTAGLAPM